MSSTPSCLDITTPSSLDIMETIKFKMERASGQKNYQRTKMYACPMGV